MLCECGCGQTTTIVPAAVRRYGLAKGQHRRFIAGHNGTGIPKSEAHVTRMRDGMRRAWATKRNRYPIGSKNHDAHGYVRVKVKQGNWRWPKEHVLVMEALIGRQLVAGEQVHHINMVRDDNRPENLFLCRDVSAHSTAHYSLNRLVDGLIKDGIVRFNPDAGEYERC